eukprot:TRINITY_DN6056_c0_g1_i1.p1 TRINITY_DN6056_c0_g1~~TRINITY_DN6056_c0_g1_i1.p1  ORF type:complete len:293 (-),score=23.30 TRINITY_DN6056_c0_g1_i1:9-887(-)
MSNALWQSWGWREAATDNRRQSTMYHPPDTNRNVLPAQPVSVTALPLAQGPGQLRQQRPGSPNFSRRPGSGKKLTPLPSGQSPTVASIPTRDHPSSTAAPSPVHRKPPLMPDTQSSLSRPPSRLTGVALVHQEPPTQQKKSVRTAQAVEPQLARPLTDPLANRGDDSGRSSRSGGDVAVPRRDEARRLSDSSDLQSLRQSLELLQREHEHHIALQADPVTEAERLSRKVIVTEEMQSRVLLHLQSDNEEMILHRRRLDAYARLPKLSELFDVAEEQCGSALPALRFLEQTIP